MANPLTSQQLEEIDKVHQIYNDFMTEIQKLKQHQNHVINAAIKRIEQEQTAKILKDLKQS